MDAKKIRANQSQADRSAGDEQPRWQTFFLAEIAAQLADLNEQLSRVADNVVIAAGKE